MSLDIYLQRDGDTIREMNWLRNPFGLIYWIEDNTGVDLWHVINDHAYDDSAKVDRAEFLRLAREAAEAVDKLERACFRVSKRTAEQFRLPPRLAERETEEDYFFPLTPDLARYIRLSPDACEDPLEYYKRWTRELLDFAVELQDPEVEYYCSN